MDGWTRVLYLLMVLVFMGVATARTLRGRSRSWALSAGIIWLCVIAGLAYLAERLHLAPG